MTPPPWINAAIRSVIWLGGAAGLAYVKKPDGASVLAVRQDAIGWLAGGICVAGLALHVWGNVSLARGERQATAGTSPLVTDGPFRYVRNPIYPSRNHSVVRCGLALSHLGGQGPRPAAALACVLSLGRGPGRGACAAAALQPDVRRVLQASSEVVSYSNFAQPRRPPARCHWRRVAPQLIANPSNVSSSRQPPKSVQPSEPLAKSWFRRAKVWLYQCSPLRPR